MLRNQHVIILLLLFFCATLSSRTIRTIFVRDVWTFKPLSDVRVICRNDTLLSDRNGIINLSDGSRSCATLLIEKTGYFSERIQIETLKDNTIYLVPYDYTSGITITSVREPGGHILLPAHVSRIRVDPLAVSAGGSVADLLDREGGVYVKAYGTGGQLGTLSMRGMGPEQTQVMLDGVPLNSLQNGNLNFGFYGLQPFSAIEIYRGAHYQFGSTGALAGTINLRAREPADQLRISGGSTYSSNGNIGTATRLDVPAGPIRQQIYLGTLDNDNDQKTEYRNNTVQLRNRDVVRQHLVYNAALEYREAHRIDLYASHIRLKGGSPKPFTGPNSERQNLARQDNDLNLVKIRYTWNGQTSGFMLQPYVRNEWMSYRDKTVQISGSALHSLHFNQEKGFQIGLRRLFSDRWLLGGGIERAWYYVRSTDTGEHRRDRTASYLISDFVLYRSGPLGETLHVNNSLRLETYSDFGTVLLPASGLRGSWDHGSVYITLGKQYRAPTFNDRYWQPGGNPDLKPEQSVHFEAGGQFHSDLNVADLELKLSVYRMDIDQQIKWVPGAGFWQPRNILGVHSQGVELGLQLQSQNGLHKLDMDLSYGEALKKKAEFSGDNTVGNRIPYDPGFLWNVSAVSVLNNLRYGIDFSGRGQRFTTYENLDRDRLPAHAVFDLWISAGFAVKDVKLGAKAEIDNLFGTEYEMIRGYPMPGRLFSISIYFEY